MKQGTIASVLGFVLAATAIAALASPKTINHPTGQVTPVATPSSMGSMPPMPGPSPVASASPVPKPN